MKFLFLYLLAIDILMLYVLFQHLSEKPRRYFLISAAINILFSIYIWYLYIKVGTYSGIADNPEYVLTTMNFVGIIMAVWLPRVVIIFLHFTGKVAGFRKPRLRISFTRAGIITAIVFFIIISSAHFFGRFNYSVEKIDVKIANLPEDLNGLTIVQISDIHLGSYYKNYSKLGKVVEIVNSFKPDLILNTGDFVSFGWNEFAGADTIFSQMKSRFGNYAILGNHDIGTYIKTYSTADIDSNIVKMKELISESGYTVLDNENRTVNIGSVRLGIAGIETRGRYPDIIYGNLSNSTNGLDSTDFRILLSHDPNHWNKEVTGKTNIDLTLAGHTHGMQFGILTPWFKWSPAMYFYPQWNGLYKEGDQYLYVNRGLGMIGMPLRLFMSPEITVIRLVKTR
jgi:predicted MPP superfamily phosphohydrolase